MARLFDCFCFFRELDLLEIRLKELSPAVDRFVLVESTWDFSGNPKPLVFEENKSRFAEYADRIEHIVVTDRPRNEGERFAWQHHQRDQLVHGLKEAAPDDAILISDLDEIPRLDALRQARDIVSSKSAFVIFFMPHHAIRLNLVQPGLTITGSRMVQMRHFRTPHLVRRLKRAYWKSAPGWLDQFPTMFNALQATGRPLRRVALNDAGWHLNSMGDADLLAAKWTAFQGDERKMGDTPWDEWIGGHIANGSLAEALGLERVPLDTLPRTVADNPGQFAHLLDGQYP